MNIIQWGDAPIRWQEVACVARGEAILSLSESAWARIEQGRAIVQHIVSAGQVAYGINTGLGRCATLRCRKRSYTSCRAIRCSVMPAGWGRCWRSPQPGPLCAPRWPISATVNPVFPPG